MITVYEGENPVFLCESNIEPTWLLDNSPIKSSNVLTGGPSNGKFWLKVINAQKIDAGSYKCASEEDQLIRHDTGYLKVESKFQFLSRQEFSI